MSSVAGRVKATVFAGVGARVHIIILRVGGGGEGDRVGHGEGRRVSVSRRIYRANDQLLVSVNLRKQ